MRAPHRFGDDGLESTAGGTGKMEEGHDVSTDLWILWTRKTEGGELKSQQLGNEGGWGEEIRAAVG